MGPTWTGAALLAAAAMAAVGAQPMPKLAGPVFSSDNICSENATIGAAVVQAVNLSWPGLEAARAAASSGDLGAACSAVAAYYSNGNSSAWLRIGPVAPGTGVVGGETDAMVFKDLFTNFPSPAGYVKMPRKADGGFDWTWYGPDNDDEFMNVFNRHQYFTNLREAWQATGNPVYTQ